MRREEVRTASLDDDVRSSNRLTATVPRGCGGDELHGRRVTARASGDLRERGVGPTNADLLDAAEVHATFHRDASPSDGGGQLDSPPPEAPRRNKEACQPNRPAEPNSSMAIAPVRTVPGEPYWIADTSLPMPLKARMAHKTRNEPASFRKSDVVRHKRMP